MGRGPDKKPRRPYRKSEKQFAKEALGAHLNAGRWQWETIEPPEEEIERLLPFFDRETILETASKWVPPFHSTSDFLPFFPEEAKHLFIDPYQAAVEGGPIGYEKFLKRAAADLTDRDKRMAKCLVPILASRNCEAFTLAKAQRDAIPIAGLYVGISDPGDRDRMYRLLMGLVAEGRLTKKDGDYRIVAGVGDRLDNIDIPKRKKMTREQQEAVRRLLVYEALSLSGGEGFEVWDLRKAAGKDQSLFGKRAVSYSSDYCSALVREGLIKENGSSARYGTIARYYLPTEELLRTKPDTLRAIIHAPMRQ